MIENNPTSRKNRNRILQLLTVSFFLTLLTGCTQSIPIRANLQLDIPATQKRTDELTIRMTEELRRMEINVQPIKMAMANSYKFEIGKSLESNLVSAFKYLFKSTSVSSLQLNDLSSLPFVLEADLVNFEMEIGKTIFSTHTAKLAIRYSFYKTGHKLFSIETNTEGTNMMSADAIVGHVLIPGESLSASGYRGSIGKAYEDALAKSVNELVTKILEVAP